MIEAALPLLTEAAPIRGKRGRTELGKNTDAPWGCVKEDSPTGPDIRLKFGPSNGKSSLLSWSERFLTCSFRPTDRFQPMTSAHAPVTVFSRVFQIFKVAS